jgi:hypothetical protein
MHRNRLAAAQFLVSAARRFEMPSGCNRIAGNFPAESKRLVVSAAALALAWALRTPGIAYPKNIHRPDGS